MAASSSDMQAASLVEDLSHYLDERPRDRPKSMAEESGKVEFDTRAIATLGVDRVELVEKSLYCHFLFSKWAVTGPANLHTFWLEPSLLEFKPTHPTDANCMYVAMHVPKMSPYPPNRAGSDAQQILLDRNLHITLSYSTRFPTRSTFWRCKTRMAQLMTPRQITIRFLHSTNISRFDLDPDAESHELCVMLAEHLREFGEDSCIADPFHVSWTKLI